MTRPHNPVIGPILTAVIIPVSGPIRVETVPPGRSTLPYLQTAVDGWIEAINVDEVLTDDGRCQVSCTVFVNEEGKLLGLPVNPRATDFCALTIGGWITDVICGDVIVLGPVDDVGHETTCPTAVTDIMDDWGWPIETA